jgi:hypothetical protein
LKGGCREDVVQFGRIQGIAVMVLGVLLLGAQAMISLGPRQPDAPSEMATRPVEHKITVIPGIIGFVSLLVGMGLIYTARRRDEPETGHAVK